MYDYIIFDVDGTLIDSQSLTVISLQNALGEVLGKDYNYEELMYLFGVPFEEMLSMLNINELEIVTNIKQVYLQHLKNGYKSVKCFAGVIQMLKDINKLNIKTGIVTSRTKEEINSDVCLSGLLNYFNFVISADDTARHKPNPDPLLKFVELAMANISKSVYIGDSYYDYLCAKNSGIDFALALWGPKNSENIEADYILKTPSEVFKFFYSKILLKQI